MTNEALSAFFDGECTPEELDHLLDAMERDPALKDRYSRMCLARDSLKGGRAQSAHLDFSSQVLAALDREAVSSVVPFQRKRLPGLDQIRGRLWHPLAGLAAAAALAAVAVLVIRPQLFAPAVEVAAAPSAGTGEEGRHWTELDAENARRLNSYIAAHSQSRAQQGAGGALSQARFDAHPSEPQPQKQRQEQAR